jgi:hypothetical protein
MVDRRKAKAVRAHSTMARHPVDCVCGCDVALDVTFGEVATRFKVRGCSGDKGADRDLRNVRGPEAFFRSP